MAEKEFFSFDEALRELRLKEEELRRLVSEGEIRAFREGDTMKLRRSDVENLRSELSGGEVVDLGGAGEELVFEDDTDLDAGMATEEISEADTELEEAYEPELAAALVEREEPMWVRAVAILTVLVLLLAVPLLVSASTGHPTDFARSIAALFGITV